MTMLKKLEGFLDENKIKYQSMTHSLAYTAQEIAAQQHIPGKQMAKVVMVKKNGSPVMVVLPADYRVEFTLLEEILGGACKDGE